MKLLELHASKYSSLRHETVTFGNLNIFVGANASGKSTILDALKFLQQGLKTGSFRQAVRTRGGVRYLFGKWEEASQMKLSVQMQDSENQTRYKWSIGLLIDHRQFRVNEEVTMLPANGEELHLLSANQGSGWWLSENQQKIRMKGDPDMCALAAASADAAFLARPIYTFVSDWTFIDPNLFSLRRMRRGGESDRLERDGQNLAERLYQLNESSPETFKDIASATKSILGIPEELEAVERNDHFHIHFYERGLRSPVTQTSVSTGTLRILTLITALFEAPHQGLVAVEEPENNIHPAALGDFVQLLVATSRRVQVLITTHSPTFLNFVEQPESVYVVRRDDLAGTKVFQEENPQGVRDALQATGFSLGEFYETKGFGR